MKSIYKNISAAIESGVPIRWVDYDLGQLDQPNPPVSWPCVLIGFDSADYTGIGGEETTGVLQIEVVVAFRLRERTHSKAQNTYRDEALEHLDTVELVRRAVSGLDGPDFGILLYSGFSQDPRADIRVWRLRFECAHYPDANPDLPPAGSDYQPWPGPGAGPDFCVHPDITQ